MLHLSTEFIYPTPNSDRLDGKGVTIRVASLYVKVGIEVDGFYWHQNKSEADLIKNEALSKQGIFIIRIRDKGLVKIHEMDLVCDLKQLKHDSVSSLLQRLLPFCQSDVFLNRIANYQRQNKFQNNEGYEQLCEMLPKPMQGRSLMGKNAALAFEWHPKNLIKPTEIYARAGMKVWWFCGKGHEWQATPDKRMSGRGCPVCAGKKKIV